MASGMGTGIDVEKLSPMMKHYMKVKEAYNDAFVLYRLGDFYELFFDDAKTVAHLLGLTLTGRSCGLDERAPMCGVPHHSVNSYIKKLVDGGHKVALCEQLGEGDEEKGMIERSVVRVYTPGTLIEAELLDEKQSNYIVTLCLSGKDAGLAGADVSTGEFFCAQYGERDLPDALLLEMDRLAPAEIILNEHMERYLKARAPKRRYSAGFTVRLSGWDLENAKIALLNHFHVSGISGFGLDSKNAALQAAGMLISHLKTTQFNQLSHITSLKLIARDEYMHLCAITRFNLEITQSIRGGSKRGTLVSILDKTSTSMGARKLRDFLDKPLRSKPEIERRLDAVGEIVKGTALRGKLKLALSDIYDMERLLSSIAYGTVNPKQAMSLLQSLEALPRLLEAMKGVKAPLLRELRDKVDTLDEIRDLLGSTIDENPPTSITEGGIFKQGYHEELDRLKDITKNSKELIEQLEGREREQTGIKTLRVSYNRVFGYYIEVTKSNLSQVPYTYTRKQTLANSERFITPELKKIESQILGALEKSIKIEQQLFMLIREELKAVIARIKATAQAVSSIDALCSLALVASEHGYVKPSVNENGVIDIKEGRHPVVERALTPFVPNDTLLDPDENRMLIITGPNMAGKSTYMRQVALIALLAHIGSFVPAKSADIALCDRIFTRVGASDDLAGGQSTFMVEMTEMANILNNATRDSLIILDEIGRGTATFDGLSIAWAVTEHICRGPIGGAKTLFATHYHELGELEGRLRGVKNYYVAVREHGDDILFLHRIMRGGSNKSFGIQVARLAGLPSSLIARANEILVKLEEADVNNAAGHVFTDSTEANEKTDSNMLDDASRAILELDLESITPLEAFSHLLRLRQLVTDRLEK